MENGIPDHLKQYVAVTKKPKSLNAEFRVVGSLKCKCGTETFEILREDPKSQTEYLNKYRYECAPAVLEAICFHCGRRILVFDVQKHGHDHLTSATETDRTESLETTKRKCRKCENTTSGMTVTIRSIGKNNLLAEDGHSINDANWEDAFDYMGIVSKCDGCGKKTISGIYTHDYFGLKAVADALNRYDVLKDKISVHGGMISIEFHKYLDVTLSDEYCEYFNSHWHPYDGCEALEFIDDLINEKYFFYENRLLKYRRTINGKHLKKFIKRKNKRFCRVFSAIEIYIDR